METLVTFETVSLVMNKLWPYIEKEVNLHLNSQEQAEKLASNLKMIQELLDDAQGKHLTDPDIKRSFEVLEATAYDMEDALDEWKMAENKQEAAVHDQVIGESLNDGRGSSWRQCFWEKVCPFVHSLCSCLNKVLEHRRIAKVVNDLNEIVDQVYEKARTEFKLAPTSRVFKRERSVPIIVEAEFPGRESEKETITKMLIEDISGEGGKGIPFSVVGIVGEGGLGKTTLAQLVYNDTEVRGEFLIKIWVCVSDTFDEVRIAEEILERLQGAKPNASPGVVAERIKDSISQKKFLLVLDDVWVEDHTKWKSLKGYLSSGAPGSMILMTTRKERAVTSILGATKSQIHRLEPLEDEACWLIIKQIALDGRSRLFKPVGLEIAKKCKGSPLAAHILGGYLRHRIDVSDWEHVLKSETWELRNVGNDLFPHFFLSYDELEPAAKRCFSYCAVLPKDTLINVEQLIRIWMAQGFLSSETDDEMERIGKDYFEDLAQRSFFQNFVKDDELGGRIVRCKMHDIVHDFAQFLTENKCHIVENVREGNPKKNCQTTRHLFLAGIVKSDQIPGSNLNLEKLRSFYCDGELPLSLTSLKCVRGLTLSRRWIESMPEEIGNLVHLRYLCLNSSTGLWSWGARDIAVPEAICNLYNLETLYLEGSRFTRLPQGISKLTNLKHIFLDCNTNSLFMFPDGFERLTSLRALNIFYNCAGSNYLACFENMNHLRGKLCIILENLSTSNVKDAEKAKLREKESLQSLALFYEENVEIDIVEALRPHPNLQHLECCGKGLLSWIPTIKNLTKLKIDLRWSRSPDRRLSKLATLAKMQFLEDLYISSAQLEHLGRDFLGLGDYTTSQKADIVLFPALNKLEFYECPSWEEWEDICEEESASQNIKIMPRLTMLKIRECMSLKELPQRLLQVASSLQHLEIKHCGYLGERCHFADRNRKPYVPNIQIIL